ncbi:MAG TPA: 2Fe-2S iron-sulfur cluster binding domain-containing protein [Lutibacter sp.]|nr:2Fe-2S iron-sulfur cluster binding domain-containing protein [Lutibacter sp.]
MISFILNNQTIKTTAKSGMTLLDFIREDQQLKGTKIGCREGDCGACTVLVGSLENDRLIYKSITSCISPLGNANGKHIVTIEGVNLEEKLNVAQQVMADNYATQCGFCTPGFIVSITGHALKQENTHSSCSDSVSGNICRCTGYKSIEKATNVIEELLKKVDSLEVLVAKGFVPAYFKTIPKKLQQLQTSKHSLQTTEGTIIANGTDLYVRHADRLSLEEVQLIGDDTSLKGIEINNGICKIGASTTVTEIAENKDLNKLFPKLKSFLKLVSSEQIRNMGTLGGNFVNASPIGDMSIFFLALDSTLTIRNKSNTRELAFKKFHQNYKKYDLQKGELITCISFKIPDENTKFNFEKVSKRTHLDIASVNFACRISVLNKKINKAMFSIGGVAAIPKVLEKTNQFLKGKELTKQTVKQAEVLLQSEISPIDDVRGTIEYKRLLARQLFFAHFVELYPNEINLSSLF